MDFRKCVVNGVDIDECKYRYYSPSHVECKCEYTTRYGYEIASYDFCRENPNCYFKQLKRKEQALNEVEKYLDAQQKYFDGEDYHNLLDIINKAKENE